MPVPFEVYRVNDYLYFWRPEDGPESTKHIHTVDQARALAHEILRITEREADPTDPLATRYAAQNKTPGS